MFEHFTFGAASQTRHDETNTSPTDLSFAPPQTPTPFSPDGFEELSDIVQQFSKQSLTRDERVRGFAAWGEAMNRPLELDSDEEEMAPLTPTTSAPPPPPHTHTHHASAGGGSISCRRMQRQLNTQLQLSPSHIRDINTLVDDMISTNSQCRFQARSSSRTTHVQCPVSPLAQELAVDPMDDGSCDSDGGFCMAELSMDDDMSLRRASAPSGIRKHGAIRYGRGADMCVGGRIKVRCTPRMRKRPVVK